MATPVKFAVAAIPATFGVPDIDSNDGPSPCCEHCILPPPNKRILTQLLARMPRIIAVLLPFLWRKRVGVEPTGDRKNLPPAGFEDREDHRTPCASALPVKL